MWLGHLAPVRLRGVPPLCLDAVFPPYEGILPGDIFRTGSQAYFNERMKSTMLCISDSLRTPE